MRTGTYMKNEYFYDLVNNLFYNFWPDYIFGIRPFATMALGATINS